MTVTRVPRVTGTDLFHDDCILLQILDMTENELEMLATHLGHDVKTHKENYRLTHSTRELTTVSSAIKS